jgi:hypothetical protein
MKIIKDASVLIDEATKNYKFSNYQIIIKACQNALNKLQFAKSLAIRQKMNQNFIFKIDLKIVRSLSLISKSRSKLTVMNR